MRRNPPTTTTGTTTTSTHRVLPSPPTAPAPVPPPAPPARAKSKPKRHSPASSYSLSEAARRLLAGPSRAEFLNGPVSGDFSDPPSSTKWIGSGARLEVETPPAGTRGGLFATHATYFDDNDSGRSTHTQPSSNHFCLPPLSDGVPSRGLFSKTKGHSRYRQYSYNKNKMSTNAAGTTQTVVDKETHGDHLDDRSSSEVGAVTTSKRSKIKRHCAKWWWVHLLVFIALVVLIVCLIIFVAIPKIAQQRINDAKLTIQGINLSQTQSQNYTLSINSTIEADSSISATIDAFEGVMYLEDWEPQTPFARIQFPQTTSASQTVVNITQFTEILDMEAFTVFNTWFLVNETINVSVEGDTKVKVKGISRKYGVNFKKTVNMPALSNFNGTTVPSSRVSLTADAQGDNFFGNVTIPNRSIITFEIGNASFTNFLLNEAVGTVFIDNMTLRPGDNNLTMRANISTSPVLDAIQIEPYCATGILPFQLQGLNVTNHGQYLPYYADSLGATNQSVSIDVGADLSDLGLNITCSTSSTKRETVKLW